MTSVSRELREFEKRLRDTASAALLMSEATKHTVGEYTSSRYARIVSCLNEAADHVSYTLGHIETHMPVDQRDMIAKGILAQMKGIV